MMLELAEDERFYFDEAAAQRPVTFIERFCVHWEGEYAGKPFLLAPWQKQVTRDLFGWKHRDTHLRRFRELYLEIAKGNGKSPWLSALGLYMLLGDGQAGAHVISAATDHKQAMITFEFGHKVASVSPPLAKRCVLRERVIKAPASRGKWEVVSGNPEGKHGARPYCLLMDEAHEWPNAKLYHSMSANAGKVRNSLILIATNAGESKQTICGELHDRAVKVLEGKSSEETLYPVIFAAGKNDDPGSVETWRKANPSYDHIAALPTYLETEWGKARQNASMEARFRRLNLSQWVAGVNKWVDMGRYDACATGFRAADVAGLVAYKGLDISLNDDLSSEITLWTGPDRWFVRHKSWIPAATARKYEDRDSIPYSEWAEQGRVVLLRENTVDNRVKRRLARRIIKFDQKHDLRAVCYDPSRASLVIAKLEAAGITCAHQKQGFALSPACEELDRRLKDGTIVFQVDPSLRWQMSNAEVQAGTMGDMRLIKPGAKGRYAGLRSAKIDAVAALITAIAQVLRDQMGEDKGEQKEWNGVFEFM